MKVTSHIINVRKTLYSFEILPPFRKNNTVDIYNILYPLMEFNPLFVNVTSHINNELQKRLKRTGTVAICGAIMSKYEIDAIPHLLSGEFTKQMTEDYLLGLKYLGIYNILILRGDVLIFPTEIGVYRNSIELVKQIVVLNKNSYHYNFCIGIAGYPEKHFEAPNIEEDVFRFYKKIKEGSSYVMTQMFFDNNLYFDYIEIIYFAGIKVSIIPGIKPISSIDQLKGIPSNFYVKIPTNLVKRITNYKKDIFHIGVEWAIQQSIELKEAGVSIIHYYTMNKPDNIYQIIIEL